MSSILDTYKDKLNPVILPDRVEFEMLTPGWYILLGLLILLFLFVVSFRLKIWFKNKYRRQAKRILLTQIKPLLFDLNQRPAALSRISGLLKEVALKSYSNTELAGMYGASWVGFLNSTCRRVNFSNFESFSFADSQYKTSEQLNAINSEDLDQLCFMAKKWIGGHSV